MELSKLRTISESQYNRLYRAGIQVSMDVTVHEVLKFMREEPNAIELINLFSPFYVRIYEGSKYVAEVKWYEKKELKPDFDMWFSRPAENWEEAESLALDFILSTLENGWEYESGMANSTNYSYRKFCKSCGRILTVRCYEDDLLCMNPYCERYIKVLKEYDFDDVVGEIPAITPDDFLLYKNALKLANKINYHNECAKATLGEIPKITADDIMNFKNEKNVKESDKEGTQESS